jgi:hypothetical protein
MDMRGLFLRAGSLLVLLAGAFIFTPVQADAPERALQVVYVRAGDAQPSEALRAWLEGRGIDYHVAWVGLAMQLDEAEMEALAERDDVLLIRAPLPSEPLPEGDAETITARVWLPTVGR